MKIIDFDSNTYKLNELGLEAQRISQGIVEPFIHPWSKSVKSILQKLGSVSQ
jgi:hypothetical protein